MPNFQRLQGLFVLASFTLSILSFLIRSWKPMTLASKLDHLIAEILYFLVRYA